MAYYGHKSAGGANGADGGLDAGARRTNESLSITDAFLVDVTNNLGAEYFRLGLILNVQRPDILRLEANHRDVWRMNHEVLVKWRETSKNRADGVSMIEELVSALTRLDLTDIVERIREEYVPRLRREMQSGSQKIKDTLRRAEEATRREREQREKAEDALRLAEEGTRRERGKREKAEAQLRDVQARLAAAEDQLAKEQSRQATTGEQLRDVQSHLAAVGGDDESQKIYDSVSHTDDVFNLDSRDLETKEKLGSGNFGSVLRGNYRLPGRVIPVAIKILKEEELENEEQGIMAEAQRMANLSHRNIVRMIGVCSAGVENIMLVLELASLGPLNKYLRSHTEMPMSKVTELMRQVADGMAYLESKNVVHRNLAARNVLLVSETFAKISDFGMSRVLDPDSDCYTAETAGMWPLKWYAPECIYNFTFDSSSDVWSYGITLWEATSYGEKPYKGLGGSEILSLIERGRRLLKPPKCPSAVYAIMERCWQFKKDERPTFKKVVDRLRIAK